MAKRFIETGFFKSPFIRSLEGSLKTLYCFIICDCSGAGIWSVDFEIASLYIGHKVTRKDAEVFLKTGKAFDLGDGKWFFPDFIEHQYPKGLQHGNPAQKNFIAELLKYNLLDEELKPLKRPYKGSKVIVKEEGSGIEEGGGSGKSGFKPPDPEEVAAYMAEINYPAIVQEESETFVNFYSSKGWMIGKNKMKDWKASVRTWKQKRNAQSTTKTGNPSDQRLNVSLAAIREKSNMGQG